jgi:serine/threonine protein kinase
LARFKNEAGLRLPCEHVAEYYDSGEEKGTWVYVTEFMDTDFEHELAWKDDFDTGNHQGTVVSEDEAKSVIAQAADGLACAHSRNVIHRDVKPANLLIRSADGMVKVTDFGIGCLLTRERRTELGVQMGRPFWMSPEQVIDPSSVDCRADIWSLGVVFYQAVTGRYPFCALKLADIFRTILSAPPQPPRKLNKSLSEETETLILRMIDKEPGSRFQSMCEIRDRLQGHPAPTVSNTCPNCKCEVSPISPFCTDCGRDLIDRPVTLVATGGPHAGEEFAVLGDLVTIGRSSDNTIRLPHDCYISRWHVRIRREPSCHTVEAWDWKQDQKPANQTLLNGCDINGKGVQALHLGDRLRLGDTWFDFCAA